MSINHPRRIFRSSLPVSGVALIVLVGSLVAVGIVVTARSRQTNGNATAQQGAGSDRLEARPAEVAVVDGGTLRLGNRVVRLLGVDPPIRDTTCKAGDGSDTDCGAASTNALAALVWEVPVVCVTRGQDGLGRPYGVCEAGGKDLNRAQVAAGWARADDALPVLKREEAEARAGNRGLWAGQ